MAVDARHAFSNVLSEQSELYFYHYQDQASRVSSYSSFYIYNYSVFITRKHFFLLITELIQCCALYHLDILFA